MNFNPECSTFLRTEHCRSENAKHSDDKRKIRLPINYGDIIQVQQ